MHAHTEFWKADDAKNSAKGLGVQVEEFGIGMNRGSKGYERIVKKMKPNSNSKTRTLAALRDVLQPTCCRAVAR
jgi:hypothetical protein